VITRADVECTQHEFESIRAAADSDGLTSTEIGGEFLLKARHLMSEDELAATHHPLHGTLDSILMVLAVGGWEGGEFGSSALAHGWQASCLGGHGFDQ
jgi:hypothetical protein